MRTAVLLLAAFTGMAYGQAVTPDGRYLIALRPGGVAAIDLSDGREASHVDAATGRYGLAVNKAGTKVYASGGAGGAVCEFSLHDGILTSGRTFMVSPDHSFVGDVSLAPDDHLLYVAELYKDDIAVVNTQGGIVLSRFKTGRRPYRILFHPSGKSLYVSSWADALIGQYEAETGTLLTKIRTGLHPSEMVWRAGPIPELFVAASDTNNVYAFSADDAGVLTPKETISVELTARQPAGTTPSALSLNADGTRLFVACSDLNAVAVVDISGDSSYVRGFIPSGTYPMSVVALEGARVASVDAAGAVHIADTQAGDLATAYRDEQIDEPRHSVGTVAHIVYVLAGSGADGPDIRAAEREFVSLSGCSVESAQQAMAGLTGDFERRTGNNDLDDPAAFPPAGYLWNSALQAGLEVRNYGFSVGNLARPDASGKDASGKDASGKQVASVHDLSLISSTDMKFRGPDATYSDLDRVAEFLRELKGYDDSGSAPSLMMVDLEDRKDSDAAMGALVAGASRLKLWKDMAVFIVAPAGRCALASPWVKHGATDSTPYDGDSVLRTIELILGLKPMTIRDAMAVPLFGIFGDTAVVAPFTVPPN